MNKFAILLLIFLLIALVFTASCNNVPSEPQDSSTPPQEDQSTPESSSEPKPEQSETEYVKLPPAFEQYGLYMYINAYFDSRDWVGLYHKPVTDYDHNLTYVQEDALVGKVKEFTIGDIKATCEYMSTRVYYDRYAFPTADYYFKNGSERCDILVDERNNKIIEYVYHFDENKAELVLSQDECREIAMNYFSAFDFVGTEEYVFSDIQLKTDVSGVIRYYTFSYCRYVNGIKTDDIASISITESGELYKYRRGNDMSGLSESILNEHKPKADKIAEDFAAYIHGMAATPHPEVEHELSLMEAVMLPDKSYGLKYLVELTEEGNDIGHVVFVVPIFSVC